MAAELSWKYGAVFAIPNKVGMSKRPNSRKSPVTSPRPGSEVEVAATAPVGSDTEDGRIGKPALGSAECWHLPLSDRNARKVAAASSNKIVLGARHSTIRLHKTATPGAVPAKVYTVEPTGDVTFVQAFLSGAIVNISLPPTIEIAPDEQIWLEFDQDRMHLFDGATEMALDPQ